MPDDPTDFRSLPIFSNCVHLTTELLPEGRTNHNYRVTADGQTYFVRLSAPGHQEHGIDREKEYAAIQNLHAIALGPRPIYFGEATGIIVTEFIDAPTWTLEQVRTPAALSSFGQAIAAMHRMPHNDGTYDLVEVAGRYIRELSGADAADADTLDFLNHVRLRIADLADPDDLGMCHNDLWYGNFINDGSIEIVDLEMAGLGDVYFDLACFFHFHDLDQAQRETFLAAYAKTPLSSEKLDQMRQAVHLRECLWALTQIKNGFTEPFYARCSTSHLEALRSLHA